MSINTTELVPVIIAGHIDNTPIGDTTPSTGKFTTLDATGDLTTHGTNRFSTTLITLNTSGNGLRISQSGAGNALTVEDQTNPDPTPFVIDGAGRVIQGNTSTITVAGINPYIQQHGFATEDSYISLNSWKADASGSVLSFVKSRSTTAGGVTTVIPSDALGSISWYGTEGTTFSRGAVIQAFAGTAITPGYVCAAIGFYNTDVTGVFAERMRISSTTNVSIGGGSSSTDKFSVLAFPKNLNSSGAASNINCNGVSVIATLPVEATGTCNGFATSITTAPSLANTSISHYSANQVTFGAGSSSTIQVGFIAMASLIGATTNLGFYGAIPSGTENYNLYCGGTAKNWLNTGLKIGGVARTDFTEALNVTGNVSVTGTFTLNGTALPIATGAYQTTFVQQATASHTLPAGNSTLAAINRAQTFSTVQTFGAGIQEKQGVISAANIDLATASVFTKTIAAGSTIALIVSNVPATTVVSSFILVLTNPGAATSLTFAFNPKWDQGVAPAFTPSGVDMFSFMTYNGGTTWFGFVLGQDLK